MPENYNHYEYKLIERRLASAMARRIAGSLTENQREMITDADRDLRNAQDKLQRITMEVVDEILSGSTRNSFARVV